MGAEIYQILWILKCISVDIRSCDPPTNLITIRVSLHHTYIKVGTAKSLHIYSMLSNASKFFMNQFDRIGIYSTGTRGNFRHNTKSQVTCLIYFPYINIYGRTIILQFVLLTVLLDRFLDIQSEKTFIPTRNRGLQFNSLYAIILICNGLSIKIDRSLLINIKPFLLL